MNFRRILYVFAIIALLSPLLTCRMDPGFSPASPATLPADKAQDVTRSYSGPFTYETLLPVALNLTVELYRQPSPAAALERQTAGGQLIVVSLWNRKGEALYSGTIPAGGTLATVLSLPAAPQDVILRLESPGYQSREVTIGGMVLYSEVNRVMGLLSEGLSAKSLLPDTDQDGVPDIYDVDPLDPEVAFQVRTPASGQFTVAFEDLFPVPGDADYNDFVANYFLLENHKSEVIQEAVGEKQPEPIEVSLMNLHGEATARAKVAGYSHKFGIVIAFPGHTATRVTREYYDSNGFKRCDSQDNVADKAVIWLFENTSRSVVTKKATFDIFFPKGITRNMVSIAPYDPVLCVRDTNKDIHLVGRDSLSGQEVSYMDPNGYPWGLLVPQDWQHPAETQYIGNAYPLFEEWRKSKGAEAPYWYLYPASTNSKLGNQAPSQVTSTDSTQLVAGSNLTQKFQLASTDPDGDKVDFLCSPAPMALQDLFLLHGDADEPTPGLVEFKPVVPKGDYLFYFWSVDQWGASNIEKPFKVTFSFTPQATNRPPGVNDLSITGSTAIGGTLTASYSFSDPDGDAEGATAFRWYRFSNSTDVTGGEAIAQAAAKSYTTGNADSGKWLRVQVTPVDDPASAPSLAGAPILSGPVRVNTLIVIDTFPAPQLNDTYLTLIDTVGSPPITDDNGFPDQKAATGSSRIVVAGGLPSGTYYIKVSQVSVPPVGSNYGIRVRDNYDPKDSSYPAAGPANEDETVPPAWVDDYVDANGIPKLPWSISLGQVIARSIYLQGTDVDWFKLTLQ